MRRVEKEKEIEETHVRLLFKSALKHINFNLKRIV
jgi:hypothetical protein